MNSYMKSGLFQSHIYTVKSGKSKSRLYGIHRCCRFSRARHLSQQSQWSISTWIFLAKCLCSDVKLQYFSAIHRAQSDVRSDSSGSSDDDPGSDNDGCDSDDSDAGENIRHRPSRMRAFLLAVNLFDEHNCNLSF